MTRSTPANTYDDDFYAWTQEQAAALRRMRAADVGDVIDIIHVAEEIEDLGKRDLREVASYLSRLFEHLIKIDNAPMSLDVAHWSKEAGNFRDSAVDAFSPSMRQWLDIEKCWQRGRDRAERELRVPRKALIAPINCPFLLDDIMSEPFELPRALQRLDTSS